MKTLVTCLIAAPLLLSSSLSWAAPRLELLPGGDIRFGMQMSVAASTSPLVADSPVLNTPTANSSTLAAAATYSQSLAYAGGTASFEWQRSASVQTSGASAQWQLGGHSAMSFTSIAGITEVYENSSVLLSADLLVADSAEPLGTPVRLSLDAASLFSSLSTLPGLAAASSFDLQLLQGLDVLAQVSSADANGLFNRQVLSAVGATLTLQISQRNTPYRLDAGVDTSVSGSRFQADDNFAGSLTVSAVPEPGAAALLLLGLAGLGLRKRAAQRMVQRCTQSTTLHEPRNA